MMFWVGLILIAATVGMVMLARPADGESAPFLKLWFVGQVYILTALVSVVTGVALVIANLPVRAALP
jgi:hypothetical protein